MLKLIPDDETEEPWYKEGLPFKCTGCGKCCTGWPGYVWVTEDEIHQIADFLGINLNQFYQKYLRYVDGRYSLRELPQNFDCIFLKDNKCDIYPVRPTQCRTYPWWAKNLTSKEDWEKAAKFCEGIDPSAPITPYEHIKSQLE